MARSTRNFALSDLALALVVIAFIGVPLVGAIWLGTHPRESTTEKRELASLPAWPTTFQAWQALPKKFDGWAHDRFGFRTDLLAGYKWGLVSIFHESASARAMVGRDGWLFVTGSGSLADMQGIAPYTRPELENAVEQINARGELLALRGIRYGFVVFPDKHTVYPQFLPRGVYGGFDKRRLDALDAAMAETGHDYYIDVSKALRTGATHSPFQLYYKSDTHWNPWGAWNGYREWVALDGARLGLKQVDYQFSQFRILPHFTAGDLRLMSGYRPHDQDIWPPADGGCNPELWPAPAPIVRKVRMPPNHYRIGGCGATGKALVIHDSFMDSISRYVSASYAKAWYVWAYPADATFGWLVDTLKPDVVIVQRVERLTDTFPPTDLDALVQELGVVGEDASINDQGDLTLGGVSGSKVPAQVLGSLDNISRDGDQLYVAGWVRMGHSSPAAVIAVVDGKVVGEAPVTLYRPDIAGSTHDSMLTWSGFRLTVPVAAAAAPDLRLYGVGATTYGHFALGVDARRKLRRALRVFGVTGESAGIDGRGNLVLGDGNDDKVPAQAQVLGSVDKISRDGDKLYVTGWIRMGRSSPAAVIAVAGGKEVGEASVTLHRPDVASAMHDSMLAWSGFRLTVPVAAAAAPDLRLYGVDADTYGEFLLDVHAQRKLQGALRDH